MAILKARQIREMKLEEIERKISELRLELMKEMANVRMRRPIKNPGKIRELKRTIARLLTIKKEKMREGKK
ncbi:MAG: 50S ribosomal protein L29 [Candidatus Aenigmatarchaeota archaeon]|nr:MAG: 50S ribosomal protein L29 [Candidatus Aenigmarchaeota archaeon]